jgi:8-oxo-dGTP pyrophosphatase MutT (NUDIX family)
MTEKRIAVVPILKKKRKQQVCLVTSRTKKHWIVPTGKYESDHSNKQVAMLEAFEEAGLIGRLDKKFCETFTYKKSGSGQKRKIKLYRMKVTKMHSNWPEKKQRKRELIPAKLLKSQVSDKQLAKKLNKVLFS